MELQETTLIVDYSDVDVVVSYIKDGGDPMQAVEVLFNISPEFEDLIKGVQISGPPSKSNVDDVNLAIKSIKEYLNI